jgi:hypothetical protein
MLAYAWSLDTIELAVGLLACIILSGALYYCHSHWFWPLMLTPSASWIFSFPTFCSSIIKKKGSTRSTTHASSRFHSFSSFDSNIEKKTPLPSRRLPIISKNGARIGGVSGLSPRLADAIYIYTYIQIHSQPSFFVSLMTWKRIVFWLNNLSKRNGSSVGR